MAPPHAARGGLPSIANPAPMGECRSRGGGSASGPATRDRPPGGPPAGGVGDPAAIWHLAGGWRDLPISLRDMGPQSCARPAAMGSREVVSVNSYTFYTL